MIDPSYSNYLQTSDGIKVFYTTNFRPEELREQDVVLVFNYGLACNVNHYQFQIPYFHDLGFKILFHDYRFHYKSEGTQDVKDCSFDGIVSDITQVVDYLGIKKTVQIGHSMGVNISLDFAYKNREITKGIVLISGTILPPQEVMFGTNIIDLIYPFLRFLVNRYPGHLNDVWSFLAKSPIMELIVHRGGFHPEKTSRQFIQEYLEKLSEIHPAIFFQLMDEMKAYNVFPKIKNISSPALIMSGDRDWVIPYHSQAVLHRHLPNSQAYTIKHGSHVPQIDFHKTVNLRIKKFLEDLLGQFLSK